MNDEYLMTKEIRNPNWAHLDTTTAWPELMFSLSSPQEERDGERRPLLLNAPLPVPLPTRASRGEGEDFWWLVMSRCAHPNSKADALAPDVIIRSFELRHSFDIPHSDFVIVESLLTSAATEL
jgi:hypothetical protein